MLGYLFILLFIVIGGITIQNSSCSNKTKKIYVILVFGSMFVYAALRGESVGIDNASRYRVVRQLMGYNWNELVEFIKLGEEEAGYSIAIWLITRIVPSPHFVGIVWDSFITFSFAYFFYKYSKDIVVTSIFYAAFVFASEMNLTRQFIAAAIFLWMIQFVLQKKYIRSFIFLFVATLFHSSAWILAIVYLLVFIDFKITRKTFLLLLVGSVSLFFFFDKIAEWFVSIFPQYRNYILKDWAVGNEAFSVLWLLIYSFLAFLLFLCLDKKTANNHEKSQQVLVTEENKILAVIALFYILYATTSMLKSEIWFVGRMNVYFLFSYCMVVPYVLNYFSYINKRLLFLLRSIFILAMFLWAISMFQQNGHGILPYVFFFE